METKDRTQANYNLVDINEQTRIAFEKCKETKEQKIERLKKEIKNCKFYEIVLEEKEAKEICVGQRKSLEQQLKELEDEKN
ncbi:MAG: hypothetical protein J6S85_10130 [Methanobrevibacter sp.]|nr:hypothetical protein [Methanobrevibacter sp.]